MADLLPTSAVRLALVAVVVLATSLQAQASQEPIVRNGRDLVALTVRPRRPQVGSLVLLSFRRSSWPDDSIASITGWMAGETLHFHPDSSGTERAFGIVPLEASDSVVARVVVRLASGIA